MDCIRSDHPYISIVIPNYNGKHFLSGCLSSLRDQTYDNFEIIIVDNGSSDGSVDFIHENFPSVKVIETGKNLGFAGGTNAGIRVAQGEYILTLNNDTMVDTRFLEEIQKPFLQDCLTGMCGSKMVLPDGRIDSTAICFSRSGAAWDRGIGERDTGQYDTPEEIFGPCAGAALYRRSMLDEIGLFDEDFFSLYGRPGSRFPGTACRVEMHVCTDSPCDAYPWGYGGIRFRYNHLLRES
jgi:GT2 family glycosyltransferase